MITPERLNYLLRSRPVPQYHTARVGEELDIQLPRVPLTAETQFVELSASLQGSDAIEVAGGADVLEGAMLPRKVHARALRPGRSVISIQAIDPSSRAAIGGVEPVEIVIDVDSAEG
ncbi:MAG TPA: hypothetical protein VKM72_35260 [Thermoanaerobaculia bacterium]|nr:hypothetical protein [Thermoanaerobaculia bacterium]